MPISKTVENQANRKRVVKSELSENPYYGCQYSGGSGDKRIDSSGKSRALDAAGRCAEFAYHEAWLRLIRDRRWSRKQKLELLDYFGDAQPILKARASDLAKALSRRPRSVRDEIDDSAVGAELAWLQNEQHNLITLSDPRYPALLREIANPPIAFFAKGNLELLVLPKVAVVGSRRPTPVGECVAREIAGSLSKLGVAVVSGLALGIDGVSHRAALDTAGPTIAVTGCGLDISYPARHRGLHQQVAENGLLISEYPFGYRPTKHTFPERNRIVSGLSQGVVIVEAAKRSGTLITAAMAIEQNREVMVVPGAALSRQYEGSHQLLREGAALVCGSAHVLELLSPQLVAFLDEQPSSEVRLEKACGLTLEQQTLLSLIDYEAVSLDGLVAGSKMDAAMVSVLLLELELEGLIARNAEGEFTRIV